MTTPDLTGLQFETTAEERRDWAIRAGTSVPISPHSSDIKRLLRDFEKALDALNARPATDLSKRLRAECYPVFDDDGTPDIVTNPVCAEAADVIDALTARVAELEGALRRTGDVLRTVNCNRDAAYEGLLIIRAALHPTPEKPT